MPIISNAMMSFAYKADYEDSPAHFTCVTQTAHFYDVRVSKSKLFSWAGFIDGAIRLVL